MREDYVQTFIPLDTTKRSFCQPLFQARKQNEDKYNKNSNINNKVQWFPKSLWVISRQRRIGTILMSVYQAYGLD